MYRILVGIGIFSSVSWHDLPRILNPFILTANQFLIFYYFGWSSVGFYLSPFLFSLYLNDLQTFLATENIKGIESVTKALEKDINVYL